MEELVNHVLYIASKYDKKLTQLQLQKISYFTIGFMIRNNNLELVENLYQEERFEAWLYGPVLPKFYEEYKKYHSTPILENGEESSNLNEIEGLNNMILKLIDTDVFDLVNVSHNHKFWKENKSKIMNNIRPVYQMNNLTEAFRL